MYSQHTRGVRASSSAGSFLKCEPGIISGSKKGYWCGILSSVAWKELLGPKPYFFFRIRGNSKDSDFYRLKWSVSSSLKEVAMKNPIEVCPSQSNSTCYT
jgi:hypothetical protein